MPGRPALWGTGAPFLEAFALKSLSELPDLREISAMDEESGVPVAYAPDDPDRGALEAPGPGELESGIADGSEEAEEIAEA